jgi:hypothetical protein
MDLVKGNIGYDNNEESLDDKQEEEEGGWEITWKWKVQ